jgi:galactose mutarotase-like enzyme
LFEKTTGFELLFQREVPLPLWPQSDLDFAKADACGADDMWPTIDACVWKFNQKEISLPDHGELWFLPWTVTKLYKNSIELHCKSQIFSAKWTKVLTLSENKLTIAYRLQNLGDTGMPAFWTFHGLINIDTDSFVEIDTGNELILVQDHPKLGPVGRLYPATTRELVEIGKTETGDTLKWYVNGPVSTGRASIGLNKNKLKLNYTWNSEELPYLGFWLTRGGFRGDWNAALEPSNSFYDNPNRALQNQTLPILGKYSEKCWELSLEVFES